MDTLTCGETQFTFSITSPVHINSEQPHIVELNALDREDAWKKIVRKVDDLCRNGHLGKDVDPQRVDIKLVNTGVPIRKS